MFVDFQLDELCREHGLVTPYDPARINPASIDLTLGREFVNRGEGFVIYKLDGKGHTARPDERFTAELVYLQPGELLLGATAEAVKIPDHPFTLLDEDGQPERFRACEADLRLKSSAARSGLDHAYASWIDPGFEGQLTLELFCHCPVTLYAGQAYLQMIISLTLATPRKSYKETGRYVGEYAQGAVLARE